MSKKVKVIKAKFGIERGRCPMCGSGELEYGTTEFYDEQLGYPVTCGGCKFTGTEWYVTRFDGFTTAEGVSIVD